MITTKFRAILLAATLLVAGCSDPADPVDPCRNGCVDGSDLAVLDFRVDWSAHEHGLNGTTPIVRPGDTVRFRIRIQNLGRDSSPSRFYWLSDVSGAEAFGRLQGDLPILRPGADTTIFIVGVAGRYLLAERAVRFSINDHDWDGQSHEYAANDTASIVIRQQPSGLTVSIPNPPAEIFWGRDQVVVFRLENPHDTPYPADTLEVCLWDYDSPCAMRFGKIPLPTVGPGEAIVVPAVVRPYSTQPFSIDIPFINRTAIEGCVVGGERNHHLRPCIAKRSNLMPDLDATCDAQPITVGQWVHTQRLSPCGQDAPEFSVFSFTAEVGATYQVKAGRGSAILVNARGEPQYSRSDTLTAQTAGKHHLLVSPSHPDSVLLVRIR